MEQPPPPSLSSTVVPAATSSIPPHVPSSHPESLDSSPKSLPPNAWDDLPPPASSKLRLMCSYNGHILPRPHDKSLCYMGGDTRIVAVDRNSSLPTLITRLSNTLLNGHHRSFTLKYQLPNEDLDSLISVTTDEDLDNMINPSDPNTLLSLIQNQDSGYILQHAQSQPQHQQFIHHHPSTGHPLQSYFQVYPSQQHQPYPFYYTTAPVPPKPYNTPVTQSVRVSDSLGSLPSTMMAPPPNNNFRSTLGGKPEAGVYATTQQGMMGGAQIVHQVPISQQQFMGYSQIHHPPQSVSAGIPNYGFEYAENAPKLVYYTQRMGHPHYQTITGPPPGMVLPDGSAAAKLPADNMTQQIRSSQPLIQGTRTLEHNSG